MTIREKLRTASQLQATSGVRALCLMLAINYGGNIKDDFYSACGFERCTAPDDLEMMLIPPSDIDYIALSGVLPKRGKNAAAGEVNGSWDKLRIPFEQSDIYRSLEQVYLNDLDWDQTLIYKSAYKKIQSGDKSMGCQNFADIQEKIQHINNLYRNIKNKGFKSQKELYNIGGKNKEAYQKRVGDVLVPNELRVAVGRNGEIIRSSNARHRISIMKLLNRKKNIPAIVQFKHTQFDGYLPYETVTLDESHDLVDYSPWNKS